MMNEYGIKEKWFELGPTKGDDEGVGNLGFNKNKFHKTCSTIMNQ